jgi:hypothetical protein
MVSIMQAPETIRRDVYAVFQFQDVGATDGRWVFVAAFKTMASARECKRQLYADQNRYGGTFPLVQPKICHPRQWQLDGYLACGNQVPA